MSLNHEQFHPGRLVCFTLAEDARHWECSPTSVGIVVSAVMHPTLTMYTIAINRYPDTLKILHFALPAVWLHVIK